MPSTSLFGLLNIEALNTALLDLAVAFLLPSRNYERLFVILGSL